MENEYKPLDRLISSIAVKQIIGDTGKVIRDLVCDSRKVSPGVMFVAVRGVTVDAHAFIDKAVSEGAVAVVCEQLMAMCVMWLLKTVLWHWDTWLRSGMTIRHRSCISSVSRGPMARRLQPLCYMKCLNCLDTRPDCCQR